MEIPKELLSKEFLSQFKSEEDVSILSLYLQLVITQ